MATQASFCVKPEPHASAMHGGHACAAANVEAMRSSSRVKCTDLRLTPAPARTCSLNSSMTMVIATTHAASEMVTRPCCLGFSSHARIDEGHRPHLLAALIWPRHCMALPKVTA